MSVNVFPPVSGGGGSVNNDFVVDMNQTANNVALLSKEVAAGAFAISLSSGDTSYDVYLLDELGDSVGYSNSASIVATAPFTSVVILGVVTSEVVSFTFAGTVSQVSAEGTAIGAGAYLTSISPSDLPEIDDTANIVGGNFGTDVEIQFFSGEVSQAAKQVVRESSTALIVTRPDQLSSTLNPWSVRAINPGIPTPSGSGAFILAGAVTGGAGVSWVTTSPLTAALIDNAYSFTLVATDADGPVVMAIESGTLPTGLSLDGSTGIVSGTPTVEETASFTVRATDAGGNFADRVFGLQVVPSLILGADSYSSSGGYKYNVFTASGTAQFLQNLTVDYLIVAGGGGGGSDNGASGGGGGAGGWKSFTGQSFTAGNQSVTVPAGGASSAPGSNVFFGGQNTQGGGDGGDGQYGGSSRNGGNGGSGGGAGGYTSQNTGGNGLGGTIGQVGGYDNGTGFNGGSGGGGSTNAGENTPISGNSTQGGDGGNGRAWLDGTIYAGGGGGAGSEIRGVPGQGGTGGGADGMISYGSSPIAALLNTGGGGGGGGTGSQGGSGIVIIRYGE
jgi:hypothetical protein